METGVINLHRMELDVYGQIWVSSRGDYYGTSSKTLVIDSRTDKVTDVLDLLPNSEMTRCGDSLYVYSNEWSYVTNSWKKSYAIVNVKTKKIVLHDDPDKAVTILLNRLYPIIIKATLRRQGVEFVVFYIPRQSWQTERQANK